MNYAFYVSGNAGRLRNIVDNHLDVLKQTKLVVTDSENVLDLTTLLKQDNIVLEYFNYKNEKNKLGKFTNEALSDFILEKFKTNKIDYCFCFGDHILKGNLLEQFKNKIINFHPSILPLFPGRNAIDQALECKNTILLGNTAHFIDSGIDTGTIIMQSIVNKSFFYKNGYEGILNLQIPMLENIFQKLEKNELHIGEGKVSVENINESFNKTSFYFY